MGNDPRLAPIIQKRDRAADLLSEANDLLPKNDFAGAKDKALQSSDMATESYNAALALRKDIGEANPLDSVQKGSAEFLEVRPADLGVSSSISQ